MLSLQSALVAKTVEPSNEHGAGSEAVPRVQSSPKPFPLQAAPLGRTAVSTLGGRAMKTRPNPAQRDGLTIAVAAVLSVLIAMALVSGVIYLFQSRGNPMAQLAAAERACAQNNYASDRDTCMREWLHASSAVPSKGNRN
jgi:hypothetical protein